MNSLSPARHIPFRLASLSIRTSFLRHVLIVAVVISGVSSLPADETEVVDKPSLQDVETFAERIFAQQAGYQPGDLVTQRGTVKLLTALEAKGWKVHDKAALLKRVLKDDDFLVRQFNDEKGREFLRKIENLPEGIDRVDRLSRLPQGEMSVSDLIHKIPNGAEWIEAMTTTRRGKILGERLSNSLDGRNFNEPTGACYRLSELAKEIHSQLEAASILPVHADGADR